MAELRVLYVDDKQPIGIPYENVDNSSLNYFLLTNLLNLGITHMINDIYERE